MFKIDNTSECAVYFLTRFDDFYKNIDLFIMHLFELISFEIKLQKRGM